MDSMDDKLLKLHPDTVMTVRRMFNLDKPGDMDKAVDALAEWLKKQHHLTRKEYPREYLERAIIFKKGSVEKAKSQIDKLCSLRTIFPKFFDRYDAKNDFNDVEKYFFYVPLPKLTADHYRVCVGKFMNDGITANVLYNLCRFGVLLSEYGKLRDYCKGYVGIFDFRQINLMDLITNADFIMVHQYLTVLMSGYGLRVKGLHAITSSKAIEVLIKMIKPMLGPKVANRIHVHTDIESLYDYLPRDVLSSDLGGEQDSFASLTEQWKNHLGTKENIEHFKEMSEAVSNEAYRMKEQLNGLDLGLAGTFRTLNVD